MMRANIKAKLICAVLMGILVFAVDQAGAGEGIKERHGAKAHMKGMRKGMQGKMGELDLTAEQKEKMKTVNEGKATQMKELHEKSKAAQEKLKAAIEADKPESELNGLHKEVQGLRNQSNDLQFERMLAVRKILTPEQRAKFQKMHHGHHGPHGDQGGDQE